MSGDETRLVLAAVCLDRTDVTRRLDEASGGPAPSSLPSLAASGSISPSGPILTPEYQLVCDSVTLLSFLTE